ncbi:hypothetical protein D9756_001824 [Leucocoprinus leucothites]|uniref:Uncharacterized protein n=1 Tax=Leucocoprinus leucothites TaxID=201217 RepID=A0A8H5G3V9_9AGAR|nr:hypothetical protein D9756_001824 [Leucoagaricus leucothites]
MQRRSFLHPNCAYTISNARQKQQESALQNPDIFVVPPEEDQTPTWCCYNSQQNLADEDEQEYTLRYPQASSYTPYFHRDASGSEGLILPARNGSSETRSIVDALGDADDFSDSDHEPSDMELEEDEENDGILPEMETDYRRTRQHRHYTQEFGVQLRPPRLEADNDSDIVEIVKVRRKSAFINDPDGNIYASSGSVRHGSTLRSRATKAFQSLRGSLRTSSRAASGSQDLEGSLSSGRSKSSLGFRSKSRSKPRAQDIFSPVENIPQPARSHTPELLRRSSGRISEFFGPALKRRASAASFTSSAHQSTGSTQRTQEPSIQSSNQTPSSPTFDGPTTPTRRSSSSTRNELIDAEQGNVPTPTRNHYRRRSEDDEPTPSWRTTGVQNVAHHDLSRSISPTPALRTNSPIPGNHQAKRGFSILNLHRIFQKTAPQSSSDALPQSMRQASSGSSACPSLSSTPPSEWSGRTSPTTDSVPQTPTSFDENEFGHTIVPVQSSSTVGSGINFGSGGAISYLSSNSISSEGTVATPGHSFSRSNDGLSGKKGLKDSFFHNSAPLASSTPELSRPSMSSSRSVVSTSTAGGAEPSARGRMSESTISSPLEASPEPPFDMSLHLNVDLDLGLGINIAPSASGGILSSNGMGKAAAPGSTLRKNRGRANLSRSLSLKNLGNKLGIGKQDVPPVPLLPGKNGGEMDFEMKLNSLHFDEISFDVDRFVAR